MRRAVSGLAKSLRVLSVPSHKEALWCSGSSCRVSYSGLSSVRIDHVIARDTGSGVSVQGRHLSSKRSSPESLKSSASEKVSVQSSTQSDTSLSLISSEGSTKSLLTGPRITSKKGYLERENMIRETQKAIRQYYKEGMYQVTAVCVDVDQMDILWYGILHERCGKSETRCCSLAAYFIQYRNINRETREKCVLSF